MDKRNYWIRIVNVPIRLIGLCLLLTGVTFLTVPFFVVFIFLGVDKANIFMSYMMRIPMNMALGDGVGDALLRWHKND